MNCLYERCKNFKETAIGFCSRKCEKKDENNPYHDDPARQEALAQEVRKARQPDKRRSR